MEIKTLLKLDARIPKWNEKSLVDRVCPFCDYKGSPVYYRPDGLTVNQCPCCESFYISPAPNEETLNNFYKNYFVGHYRDNSLDVFLSKNIQSSDPLSDFRICEIVSNIDVKEKNVLDVGCGNGRNLFLLKKLGANVTGIDLDPDAVRFVKEKLGIDRAFNCSIEALDDSTRFDIIIMYDLIEHLLNPKFCIEKACKLLSANGLLLIWTGNASQKRGVQPILFRVDLEHMQYLSLKACQFISRVYNIDIVHIECAGYPHIKNIDRLANQKYNMSMHLLVYLCNIFRSGLFSKIKLMRARDDIRLGDYNLFCIFKKRDCKYYQ